MDANSAYHRHHRKDKVIVIMGATGTGKSRLSVDLATRFSSDIINSHKMQVYRGLDITTNKIPVDERLGVPHHLLGQFDPENGELSPEEFRQLGGSVIADITSRRKVPIIAVGLTPSFMLCWWSDSILNNDRNLPPGSDIRYHRTTQLPELLRGELPVFWVELAEKMVRNAKPLVNRDLVGGDVQPSINLHFVRVNDFLREPSGKVDRKSGFSGPGCAHDDKDLVLPVMAVVGGVGVHARPTKSPGGKKGRRTEKGKRRMVKFDGGRMVGVSREEGNFHRKKRENFWRRKR
ncbi:hypothetical protein L6164_026861 [Bauhinia variegata]|uniref:Uncharacterized protein n=1 Tax=Bauhinia variegata TaxID=167791 RepID=A0ACB9LRU1_BAUVA|nr:hypothetical protein L6164_026861 [Bauhinia variegata]